MQALLIKRGDNEKLIIGITAKFRYKRRLKDLFRKKEYVYVIDNTPDKEGKMTGWYPITSVNGLNMPCPLL